MLSAANIMHILAAKRSNARIIVHSHNAGTITGLIRKTLRRDIRSDMV